MNSKLSMLKVLMVKTSRRETDQLQTQKKKQISDLAKDVASDLLQATPALALNANTNTSRDQPYMVAPKFNTSKANVATAPP